MAKQKTGKKKRKRRTTPRRAEVKLSLFQRCEAIMRILSIDLVRTKSKRKLRGD